MINYIIVHCTALWIAFRFCIFVLWTQSRPLPRLLRYSCELLSDFVYSFFEHNNSWRRGGIRSVVNCFQILYIRSLNTMQKSKQVRNLCCEVLSDFVYSFFEHNIFPFSPEIRLVVNCFQILYIRSLNTIRSQSLSRSACCELLSDFVYSFFEHNRICVERWGTTTYDRCSRIKKSGFCRIFWFGRAGFQNNSNWMPSSGRLSDFCELKSSIAANCLSVMRRIPTFPLGGRKDFALFMWTSAFSALAQWRR